MTFSAISPKNIERQASFVTLHFQCSPVSSWLHLSCLQNKYTYNSSQNYWTHRSSRASNNLTFSSITGCVPFFVESITIFGFHMNIRPSTDRLVYTLFQVIPTWSSSYQKFFMVISPLEAFLSAPVYIYWPPLHGPLFRRDDGDLTHPATLNCV